MGRTNVRMRKGRDMNGGGARRGSGREREKKETTKNKEQGEEKINIQKQIPFLRANGCTMVRDRCRIGSPVQRSPFPTFSFDNADARGPFLDLAQGRK